MRSSNLNHWWLVTVRVGRDAVEAASVFLFDLGSTGIVTLDETPNAVNLGADFDESANTDVIKSALESKLGVAGIEVSAVADQDWMQKWKEGFDPGLISDRCVMGL